ncbi:phage/plasmid primase, P4 family [Luteibacter sp.]|uniref:phage/plasmid primase, P4 family n=1 Tax=Luteibacter sp. TaxID=1886636 RepID=UPI00280A2C86|nr:phage/plasmid primase, P4 family [Luteibacter sp.]MDQ8050723.1 phage/plasmid primase, P4 family [Luteibacter sp.]
MISHADVIRAFQDSLANHGIAISDPSRIELDGKWHRAHVEGDRGRDEHLAYRIHFDDRPAGYWKDHKRGAEDTFSVSNGEDLDPAARAEAQARWRAESARREAEREQGYQEAAQRAQAALQAAPAAAADHPYLARKGIVPGASVRVHDGRLLIPVVTEIGGKPSSYQTISADGEKLFMPGGRMAGAFHPITGPNRSRVLVCEGYATGAALHRATGYSVACAMSAGNVPAVTRYLVARFPDREVVICPDNDHGTQARTGSNPGLEAAAGLGCRVVAPAFPADADPKATDWDDWLRGYGTAAELVEMIAGEPATDPPPERGRKNGQDGEASTIGGGGPDRASPSRPQANHGTSDAPSATAVAPNDHVPATRTDLDATTDPNEEDTPDRYSEDNVALAFSTRYADDFRYVAPWGRWMRWHDQRWVQDETILVFDEVRKLCRGAVEFARRDTTLLDKQKAAVAARFGASNTVAAVERFARADRRHAATVSQWDADPWLLNTPAGVVDLRNGHITAGSRRAYMTKITRVAPGGACEAWHRFLHTATAGDNELIAFLQRMAGYCLTGSTRDHALFFVYGTGGNGKGTFLNTLQWIIGDYAKSAPADMFTERKHEAHSTELARLMGARLVAAQETEEGKRWAEAKIKALTGGDPVTARFMRQDDFEFIPQFKLVMTGNHKPGLRNVDEAIKRRLHLIPFTVTIAPQDRDVGLAERLKAEAGGILQWAIEGCQAWQRDGLRPPAAVVAATDEYLEQQDVLGAWIEECCVVGANEKARRGDLYKSFKAWAEKAGEYVLPQKRFVASIETRGIVSKMRDGVQYCEGLRVKPDADHGQWGNWERDFD